MPDAVPIAVRLFHPAYTAGVCGSQALTIPTSPPSLPSYQESRFVYGLWHPGAAYAISNGTHTVFYGRNGPLGGYNAIE